MGTANERQVPTTDQAKQYCAQFLWFWVDWAAKQSDQGIGYRRRADSWDKPTGNTRPSSSSNITSEDELAMAIESKVLQLPDIERDAILVHYLRPQDTLSEKAKRLRITRQTLSRRLQSAHVLLFSEFRDLVR